MRDYRLSALQFYLLGLISTFITATITNEKKSKYETNATALSSPPTTYLLSATI